MTKLIVTMVLAHFADLWTTWLALGLGCTELNPIYHVTGFWGLGAIKISIVIGIAVASVWYQRRDVLWLGIGGGALCAVWNILMFPYCATGF